MLCKGKNARELLRMQAASLLSLMMLLVRALAARWRSEVSSGSSICSRKRYSTLLQMLDSELPRSFDTAKGYERCRCYKCLCP